MGVVGIPHPIYDELPVAFISKIPNKEVCKYDINTIKIIHFLIINLLIVNKY